MLSAVQLILTVTPKRNEKFAAVSYSVMGSFLHWKTGEFNVRDSNLVFLSYEGSQCQFKDMIGFHNSRWQVHHVHSNYLKSQPKFKVHTNTPVNCLKLSN